MSTKFCRKCGIEKPLDSQHFRPQKSLKGGYRNQCRACEHQYDQEYKKQNHEIILERARSRYNANIEQERERARLSMEKYRSNPENREKERQRKRIYWPRYYREHGAEIRHKRRSDKYRAFARKYYYKHRHTERYKIGRRITTATRRARKLASPEQFTADDVQAQYRAQKGNCWWCGIFLGDTYHVDHLTPLAKGGSNGARNIVIACPDCNFRKNRRMPWEFNGRLL